VTGHGDGPGDSVGPVGGPAARPAADAAGPVGGPAAGVLVIGYGNRLRSDDGVGWHAADLLAGDPRLAGGEVLALHQLAPELALDMSRASLVILVDASVDDPPGAITVRSLGTGKPGGRVPGPGAVSHHVDPGVLLALARDLYGAAPEAYVVSVGTANMEVGAALSPTVAGALPAIADAVADLVAAHHGSQGGSRGAG
jgi:hydrogenase maturation protease